MIRTFFVFCAAALIVWLPAPLKRNHVPTTISRQIGHQVDMSAMISFMSSMDSTGLPLRAKCIKGIQDGMDSVANSKENGFKLEVKFDTVTKC